MSTTARAYAQYQARVAGGPVQGKTQGKIPHRKVLYDGYTFDSGIEYERYKELRILEHAGQIKDLVVHPVYPLVVNDQKIGQYTADFAYWQIFIPHRGKGMQVIEDVKSQYTRKDREYRRTCKLMKACYGITISEVVR